jgi:hypothetical protein
MVLILVLTLAVLMYKVIKLVVVDLVSTLVALALVVRILIPLAFEQLNYYIKPNIST